MYSTRCKDISKRSKKFRNEKIYKFEYSFRSSKGEA